MTENQRLSKTLAACGVASRRACEELIFSGKVKVNGIIIKVPQTLVSLTKDRLEVDDIKVKAPEQKAYYILNKPSGYTCSNTRIGTKKIISDLFTNIEERLFTIGRLDRDTTGLLLVTNDGHFANEVIHPRSNISKEYLVKMRDEITHEDLVTLSKGTLIEGKWIKPRSVKKVRHGVIKIVVKEGKKREVRLMVQNAGLTLVELKRIRIGGLLLGNITEGQYRPLAKNERDAIFQ